jgi:tRNA (guanine-N(7)-)-methyltransferase subunit TRM82
VVITADNKTIISADKFGDVYSLPLIPTESKDSVTLLADAVSTPSTPQPFRSQASALTVHTKRNLRALENQRQQSKMPPPPPAWSLFEHDILLGHVSMLTAVALGTSATGKQYIISADRDEHIRVSRGLPQAHIIEGFCLGHTEFVSRLCVLPGRPEILVSGGGDDELFVWDWLSSTLASTADLLKHIKEVEPTIESIAVSVLRVISLPEEEEQNWILAACERYVGSSPCLLSMDSCVGLEMASLTSTTEFLC